MSRPWVKYHWGVLDNDRFQRLTSGARLTFLVAIGYAAKLDADGDLVIPNVGPADARDFVRYTGLSGKAQAKALSDLVVCGFIDLDPERGIYSVARWSEKAGDESARVTNAARQRRFRNASVTQTVTPRNADVTKIVTDRAGEDKDLEGDKELVEAPTSPLPVAVPTQAERVREKPQPTLALNRDVLDRASELKGLHWRLVEASGLKLSVGKTLWGKRNNAVARALAENGITAPQYEIAWKSLQTEMGEAPREMAPVSKHLDRLGTPKGRRANDPPRAPYHQPYRPESEPELTDAQREANRRRLRELTSGNRSEVAS